MSIIEKALNRHRDSQPGVLAKPRATSVPAVASVSGHPSGGRGLPEPATLVLDVERLENAGLAAPPQSRRIHVHQFRILKRAVLDCPSTPGGASANLVMITSAVSGEGKSYVSFNLAQSLALELDRRVLLVDADVPKRDLTRALGADESPGLLDLLVDEQLAPSQVINPTSISGLSFLPAGHANEYATELIASDRMSRIAAQLCADDGYGTVIFDSAPILLTSESVALMRIVGQVLVVVRASVTPQDMVREVVARIDSSKRIATVLNDWQPIGANDKQYQAGYQYYGDGVQSSRTGRGEA